MKERWNRLRCKGLLGVWAVFLLMALILFAERSGIKVMISHAELDYLPTDEVKTGKQVMDTIPHTCLLLYNPGDESGMQAKEQFPQILEDMKVGFREEDVSSEPMPDLDDFKTVIVTMADLSVLGENVLTLSDWVHDGGRVMFAMSLQKEIYSTMLEPKLDILSSGYDYALVDSVLPDKNFMLGGGEVFGIMDGFDSAWAVELGEKAEVFMTTGGENKVPLVWRTQYGKGCFVVVNLGFCEKATCGFYSAAYSLLEPVCAWPVLNGATFYLDDFPSPVPSGDGHYVWRDYHTSVADFYANIWWPDMMALAEKYGFSYTGVVIENYEDDTESSPERQTDTSRFQFFGNMLLRAGGEIGYHGYNHQPLCTNTTDYGDILPYNTWPDEDAMKDAVQELVEFEEEQFPEAIKSVYVPPSNVISEEGRSVLVNSFPQIRTIASNYFGGEMAYEQEFGVAEDGIVEQPRITAGAILDDYTKMVALSELNLHLVSNHFLHPDDLLDEDRGAALGWETMKKHLTEYMDWLYTSVPEIRRFTGSELSASIQRFSQLTVETEQNKDSLTVHLGNFVDEASILMRFNEGVPGKAEGGELIQLTDTLYLLRADKNTVVIPVGW